ncbi:MAG: hypothetical protein ACE5GE_10690, partial [Phycisphaerae bacterium]
MTLRVAIVLLTCASAQTAPPSVTDEQVDLAIGRAVQYLWSQQDEAGQWHDARFDRMYPGGMTCLAAFALRTAGAGIGDVRLQKAVNVLLATEGDIRSVYGRSFRLMLWASLDPQKYRKPFKADVRFLTGLQNRHGAWGYGHVGVRVIPRDWSDASNSQLAILALWTANQFGGEVGRKIWERAEESWLQS